MAGKQITFISFTFRSECFGEKEREFCLKVGGKKIKIRDRNFKTGVKKGKKRK